MELKPVLIVGKDQTINDAFGSMLRLEDYPVEIVSDFALAEKLAAAPDPPIVLLVDSELTEETLEFARKFPGLAVLITGNYFMEDELVKKYKTYLFRDIRLMPIWQEDLIALVKGKQLRTRRVVPPAYKAEFDHHVIDRREYIQKLLTRKPKDPFDPKS